MSNLVSDNQGREVARLARSVRVPRDIFQAALTNGTMNQVLTAFRDGLPVEVGSAVECPDWVKERLTPEFETLAVCDPGKVEFWFHPSQLTGGPHPIGQEVYKMLKSEELLDRALSYGHLEWYEANPDKIPAEFRGKRIYGWASTVRRNDDRLFVPHLCCDAHQPHARPYIHWTWLIFSLNDREPAGLRAR